MEILIFLASFCQICFSLISNWRLADTPAAINLAFVRRTTLFQQARSAANRRGRLCRANAEQRRRCRSPPALPNRGYGPLDTTKDPGSANRVARPRLDRRAQAAGDLLSQERARLLLLHCGSPGTHMSADHRLGGLGRCGRATFGHTHRATRSGPDFRRNGNKRSHP